MMTGAVTTGRVWKFGDDINTDLIMPGAVYDQPEDIQTRATFAAVRPGFADMVTLGDVIVAGSNFGTGSSRPAARSLRNVGIRCLLAESINGLFVRNCVNFGLLALEAPGITTLFEEGDMAEVDLSIWQARNPATGRGVALRHMPERLLTLMREGGIFPVLERQWLIAPLVRGG
jgi:3-isopropylmalate/(R)-2-methylmalate dehydratase small subunit